MSLWRLILGEMGHRRLSFALGCLAVAVAAGCVAGAILLLRGHDAMSERMLAAKERETRQAMARLEDDYRIIMRRMGYNTMILHRDQDPGDLHRAGHPTVSMPESHVDRLAQAGIATLNHLLPVLQQRWRWPETDREVLLTGIRGQVPIVGQQAPATPIMPPLSPGHLALGHLLAKDLDLTAGSAVTLMGEPFRVHRVQPPRGNAEDLALWVPLEQAQTWLGLEDRINGILALECICQPDSLGRIEAEVTAVLPDTRVIEFASLVRGRAEARQRAAEAHQAAIAAERTHWRALRQERERVAAVLVPLVVGAAALGVLFLTWGNVRERRSEIAILRALGVSGGRILSIFLMKAVLTGFLGGAIGVAAGMFVGSAWGGVDGPVAGSGGWAGVGLSVTILMLAPLLTAVASLVPAMNAARQDPAEVLREG